MLGATILIFFILSSLLGPLIYRVDREALDFSATTSGSSLKHPMGTDDLGRDILARVLFGGRISLSVGMVAMLIAITVGTTIGAVAGFFGGWIDNLLMRFTDMFLALPQLPLLLLTIYLFREPVKRLLGPETGIFVIVVGMLRGVAVDDDRADCARLVPIAEAARVRRGGYLPGRAARRDHVPPHPAQCAQPDPGRGDTGGRQRDHRRVRLCRS